VCYTHTHTHTGVFFSFFFTSYSEKVGNI
jgi:hypothetical protein